MFIQTHARARGLQGPPSPSSTRRDSGIPESSTGGSGSGGGAGAGPGSGSGGGAGAGPGSGSGSGPGPGPGSGSGSGPGPCENSRGKQQSQSVSQSAGDTEQPASDTEQRTERARDKKGQGKTRRAARTGPGSGSGSGSGPGPGSGSGSGPGPCENSRRKQKKATESVSQPATQRDKKGQGKTTHRSWLRLGVWPRARRGPRPRPRIGRRLWLGAIAAAAEANGFAGRVAPWVGLGAEEPKARASEGNDDDENADHVRPTLLLLLRTVLQGLGEA
eukprot:COSAG06_NODE_15470_length_1069_cov_0.532990_1_plen_274_part_10